jgi:hypothetical protein
MLEINERYIKFANKWGPIPPGLIKEDGDNIITVNGYKFLGTLVKYEHFNNQDGTFDEVPVLKFLSVE